MNWRIFMTPRVLTLLALWALPIVVYIIFGAAALIHSGWFFPLLIALGLSWGIGWLAAKFWPAPRPGKPPALTSITTPKFWTSQDTAAIAVVEEFRAQAPPMDRETIANINRYTNDAQTLAIRLGAHYYEHAKDNPYTVLTFTEILAVAHLAIEDVEQWVVENLPVGNFISIGQMQKFPGHAETLDQAWKLYYIVSSIFNPAKLLAYPMWRGSTNLSVKLQNEALNLFYQFYLRQFGYYLIEMYSGRLKGGSRQYRQQFGRFAAAIHRSGGDLTRFDDLQTVDTKISVMGQVKAGKSSLINALMKDRVAQTNILPQTREVEQYILALDNCEQTLTLLDTPGYDEADVTQQQRDEIKTAAEQADLILLVIAANSAARDADFKVLKELQSHYLKNKHIQSPKIIVVLTHCDLLRPIGKWEPPYDWEEPQSAKEHSISGAVQYCREIFGDGVIEYACVNAAASQIQAGDTSVNDELVPLLVKHLDSGKATAVLRAFYTRLNKDRWSKLPQQMLNLFQSVGNLLD